MQCGNVRDIILQKNLFQKGVNVTFDCGVEVDKELLANTKIEWKKFDSNGVEVVTFAYVIESNTGGEIEEFADEKDDLNRFVQLSNNSLRIFNPTEQDIGIYKCFVNTPIDEVVFEASLYKQKDIEWLHILIIIIICILIVLITIMCIVCVRKRSRRKGKYGVEDVGNGKKSRNR